MNFVAKASLSLVELCVVHHRSSVNAHLILLSQDPADNTLSEPGEIPPDPSVGAVLIGLDTAINYTKLSRAFRYLHSNPECFFLATNRDTTYPSDKGLMPGAGAILSPLITALGPNRPVTAIGKPSTLMLDAIKAKCVQTYCLVTCTPLPGVFYSAE